MSDGHTGTDNTTLGQRETDTYALALSGLRQTNGATDFVLHAAVRRRSSFGTQAGSLLRNLGFREYEGRCPFHERDCLYAVNFSALAAPDGFVHTRGAEAVRESFYIFADSCDRLFQLWQEQQAILGKVAASLWPGMFGERRTIEVSEGSVPTWVEPAKYPRLRQLERQKDDLEKEIADLGAVLPLVYGTDDAMEDAVVAALQYLGLEALKMAPGANIDISARDGSGARRFGIEVTGIRGSIGKRTRKLGQMFEFEQERDDQEQGIVVAGTYNDRPVEERDRLEHFTPDAVRVMSPLRVLLMTGVDLYRLVGDVLESRRTREEVVDLLYTRTGLLSVPPAKPAPQQ